MEKRPTLRIPQRLGTKETSVHDAGPMVAHLTRRLEQRRAGTQATSVVGVPPLVLAA